MAKVKVFLSFEFGRDKELQLMRLHGIGRELMRKSLSA